jgi:hydrogenase nickel incorporation protein HypA/HybF
MGLCEAIVEAALRCANGRRVSDVRVRVTGHPVDQDVIDQGFRMAAAGTQAEHAAVDLVVEPLSARCRACDYKTSDTDPLAMVACSRCESLDIEMVGEERVVLESITFAPSA